MCGEHRSRESRGGGAAIDKQLVETVGKYARPEHVVLTLDNQLIPRISEEWKAVEGKLSAIAEPQISARAKRQTQLLSLDYKVVGAWHKFNRF